MQTLTRFLCAIFLFTFANFAYAEGITTHSVAWSKLETLRGKYLGEKPAKPLLTPVLRSLLKTRYKTFDNYITVQGPIDIADDVVICYGMEPHSGGENAAFAFFSKTGGLFAAIKTGEKFEYFGDKTLSTQPAVAKALKTYSN